MYVPRLHILTLHMEHNLWLWPWLELQKLHVFFFVGTDLNYCTSLCSRFRATLALGISFASQVLKWKVDINLTWQSNTLSYTERFMVPKWTPWVPPRNSIGNFGNKQFRRLLDGTLWKDGLDVVCPRNHTLHSQHLIDMALSYAMNRASCIQIDYRQASDHPNQWMGRANR